MNRAHQSPDPIKENDGRSRRFLAHHRICGAAAAHPAPVRVDELFGETTFEDALMTQARPN